MSAFLSAGPGLDFDVARLQPMPPARRVELHRVVRERLNDFARDYRKRRLADMEAGGGLLDKLGNPFFSRFPLEYAAYSTISRSLDSALGTEIEELMVVLAGQAFGTDAVLHQSRNGIKGALTLAQSQAIAGALSEDAPAKSVDFDQLATSEDAVEGSAERCMRRVDVLIRHPSGQVAAIETKFGGQLDVKKSKAEKKALLEFSAVYFNETGVTPAVVLGVLYDVHDHSGKPWRQGSVNKYFDQNELLVGRNFWNFVLDASDGYDVFIGAWQDASGRLGDLVEELRDRFVVLASRKLGISETQPKRRTPAQASRTMRSARLKGQTYTRNHRLVKV